MKIPFRLKSTRSNKREELSISNENFQPNKRMESNNRTPGKNIPPLNFGTNYQICFMCKKIIAGESKKPEWKWNLDTSQSMCVQCYERKSKEYEKIRNCCNQCNKKLGFIRYNPKPLWGINGQLCRSCWDLKNSTSNK